MRISLIIIMCLHIHPEGPLRRGNVADKAMFGRNLIHGGQDASGMGSGSLRGFHKMWC